ncbi:hypothetical protein J2T16_000254 [Paenibacillus intestini]|uniref:Secreted protein n=1 Tax=Paenibacillus cucumis (ex Kampfer et al. 2016) TaxID=1776858 RepID=A0ABS7KKV3_9BACL|nr:hypothetical protein [Paenibacillus cucumis (ex Kampfer et al. 2016)]MBY0204819.1 hypothetical protein [Paenibacillus cucumis (ex Kampfer et al. 2016)]MDP9697357.1 hypothetical protein [Paenibacillus intestini]
MKKKMYSLGALTVIVAIVAVPTSFAAAFTFFSRFINFTKYYDSGNTEICKILKSRPTWSVV